MNIEEVNAGVMQSDAPSLYTGRCTGHILTSGEGGWQRGDTASETRAAGSKYSNYKKV